MSKRRPRFRPAVHRLEDRAVPSVDLSQVIPLVDASYASFAATVRQDEVTLATPTTGTSTAASVESQVESAIVTLEQSLASELTSAPATSELIFQQLDAGGLGGQMAALFNSASAGSPNGAIPPPSLSLLYSAVDAEISGSYQQVAGDLVLSSITPPAGSSGTATISTLAAPAGSSALVQVEYATVALEQTLASELTSVPTGSSLIFQQLDANGLGGRMAALFDAATAATADGSVPQSSLPLLYSAVDAEISASFQQTAGDIALDATGQANGSAIPLAAISGEVDAAYATFAAIVRGAEASLVTSTTGTGPTGGGPTGGGPTGGGPGSTEALTVGGSDAVVGTTGTSTLTFTVTLSAASTSTVTVDYATSDNTAIAGTDYQATSGTLTFAPGVTSLTVPVTVDGETTTATDKTFDLNLSNATNATITSGMATGDIIYATGTPSISAAPASASVGTSGTSTLTFTVSLSAVSANPVTVDYATADGTAIAGTDYTSTSGTLTFAPGTTSETVAVAATGESSTVTSKTLTLDLSGATGTTNATASAVGTLNYIVIGQPSDLSDNLTNISGGVETATGTTDVAASFSTGTSNFTLNNVTLLLDQATAGQATVAIYSDGGLQPGTLIGTLTAPTTYSATPADATFTSAAGIALTANTTYWVVLSAPSGAYDWSWTSVDTGSGVGFTDTWAESSDGGTTWFAYDSSPTQFSVTATATS